MDKSTGAHKKSDTDRETHVAKLPAHIFSADVNKTFTDLQFIAFQKCIISFQIPMVSLHPTCDRLGQPLPKSRVLLHSFKKQKNSMDLKSTLKFILEMFI